MQQRKVDYSVMLCDTLFKSPRLRKDKKLPSVRIQCFLAILVLGDMFGEKYLFVPKVYTKSPRDPQLWVENVGRCNLEPSEMHVIWSDSFGRTGKIVRLGKGAVPIIFNLPTNLVKVI